MAEHVRMNFERGEFGPAVVASEEVPTEEGRRSGLDRRLIALSASQ
jgi:hypothetical protein